MRIAGWIGCALLFLGCQTPPDRLPYPITITPEGVGPIHLNEPFDIALLRRKLPGFELEKLSEVTAEKTQTLIRLKRGDMPIALLFADEQNTRLSQILILSPLVKNGHGLGINDPLPLSEHLTCVRAECRDADESSILYRIEPDTHIIREIVLQSL